MVKEFFTLCYILLCFLSGTQVVAQNVSVKTKGNTIEIKNGLLGIVIPAESAFKNGQPAPAPVQAFIYSNGVYSNDKPNELKSPTPPVAMNVKFVTNSSTEVTVSITYSFQKKEFQFSKAKYKGGEAGPGFYSCLITVKKGGKAILIEEDSDYDISYSVSISNGLWPDKARYRGWSSSDIKLGYEPSGNKYRSEDERRYPLDATVDIDYSKSKSYPPLVLWEPAGGEVNSGRYWQVFNSKGDNASPLIGFFQGQPRRLIGGRSAGVRLEVSPEAKEKNQQKYAAFTVEINRRGPDNSWYPRKRFQWGLFISTKADLPAPEKTQPIAKEMNRISGLGSKIKTYAQKPVKIVPAFYKGAIYMPAGNIQSLQQKIKKDAGFYKQMCHIDEAYKAIWDVWRYPDSAASLKKHLINFKTTLEVAYTEGEASYTSKFRYWKGSNLFKQQSLLVSALLADANVTITPDEKKTLEQLIALMARILWDDNNVPFVDSAGINYGPANMPLMYNNTRVFFALLLADDPEFRLRAQEAVQDVRNDIRKAIYENGAGIGSPHYIQPAVEPVLYSMLQIRQSGMEDLFVTEPRVERFARFYLSLLTPPSVRFSNNRKLISFGDGSEESASVFALLATGLWGKNKVLSEALYAAYCNGPMRTSVFGSLGLSVNLSYTPPKIFTATTSNYTGYHSHFRSGINTANETALWVLNGNKLYDHRNDDAGELAIYALKAPLSLSRSSFYYPSATDARIRSVVVPEKMFPEWNQPNQPITGRSLTNRTWPLSDLVEFAHLGYSSTSYIKMSTKNGAVWYRKINMVTLHEEAPIIAFYDSIPGNEANIWSMLMMSEGAVRTPAGLITPEKRIYDNNKRKELPRASPVKELSPGLNRFVFNGQQWPAHPANGINWELYTLSSSNMQFTVAEWGTTWQNTIETNEFKATNKRAYSEEQQIIRLHSDKPFFNILLPYVKGENPYQESVKSISPNSVLVEQQGNDIIISPDYYVAKTKDGFCGALLSSSAQFSYNGITITGGYTELEYDARTVKIRVHGNTGNREIKLPFALQRTGSLTGIQMENTRSNTVLTINYRATGNDLPNGEKGYAEFTFNRK